MPRPSWHNEARAFVEMYGIDHRLVEDVVAAPSSVELDPRSNEVGYPVKRLRRGDVLVVVGYREPEDPTILFVRLTSPEDHIQHGHSHTGGGRALGESIPDSPAEMVRRVEAMGYEVRYGKHRTLYKDGEYVTHLSSTPRDRHAVKAAWREVLKYEAEHPKETP